MQTRLWSSALLLLLGGTFVAAQPPGPATQLVYRVKVPDEGPRQFEFSLEVLRPQSESLVFVIPLWAPGAYREITVGVRSGQSSWRGLTGFQAVDEKGATRRVQPDGDRRWRVDSKGAGRIVFRWNNPQPGRAANNRSFLTRTAGMLDGPRSWMYVEGRKDLPAHVHFDVPEGWQIATGLDPTFDPTVFHANDYDRLADCPTFLGKFASWTFHVRGVPHRVVVQTDGREPRFDAKKFIDMVRRVVVVYTDLFDDVPYPHYTFIYSDGGGGGLEHLTSTTISAGRASRLNPRFMRGITAHEFFHTWNVKRLRPKALGPFDYTRPVPVDDLWICEGLTEYYTAVGLWRAGLTEDPQFLAAYARSIGSYERNPVCRIVSPQESSRAVWERGRTLSSISYYLQGEVLGLCIDLAIRDRSGNRKSLDDAMRRLYRTYGGYYRNGPPQPGFSSQEFLDVVNAETGVDMTEFWNDHVRDAKPVPWNRYLALAGWQLGIDEETPTAFGNVSVRRSRLRVRGGSPLAGLGFRDGDQVLEVNGSAVRRGSPRRMFRALRPGEQFSVKVRRGGAETLVSGRVATLSELAVVYLEQGGSGPRVAGVARGTALHRGGLRRGDEIIGVGGEKVADVAVLRSLAARLPTSGKTRIEVLRNGQRKAFDVELAPHRRTRVGRMTEVESPTPRQLHLRRALKSGATIPFDG